MNSFFVGSVFGQYRGSEPGSHVAAVQAGAKADRAQTAAQNLEDRLERALMTMEAMWNLLSERLGVTDEELQERMVELDLCDGHLDGRVRRPVLECAACKRRVPRRFHQCMYCGADVERDPFA